MSFDNKDLRNALGQFPTGVCVITSAPEGTSPFGMTVNSFSSLSLDPALLLWSLQKNSDLAKAWDQATHFAVNVLKKEQVTLSNTYAKKNDHDLRPQDYRIGKTGNPVLKESLVNFECRIHARHDGGDHIIIVGEVLEMNQSPTGEPLVFHSGQYRELH